MIKVETRKKLILSVLMIIFFAYFSLWALTIPFDGAPDEELRYMIPKYIYNHLSLPTGYQSEVIYREGYYSYAFYPQYFGAILSAVLMKVSSVLPFKVANLLYFARLASVFSGMGVAYFFGKSCERLSESFLVRVFAMSLVAFWPQLTFLSAYVNNDIIGLLGVAIIIDTMLATSQKEEWDFKDTIQLSIGYVICLLGYINTYAFVLFSGFYFLFILLRSLKNKQKSLFWCLNHCLILALVLLICVLPFFLRNYVLYHDLFGNKIFEARNHQWISEGHKATMFPFTGGNFLDLTTSLPMWESTLKSLIGTFGYMSIPMKDGIYSIYKIFMGIGLCVFIPVNLYHFFKRRMAVEQVAVQLVLLLSSMLTIFLFLYRSFKVDFQAQGRYIIAIIIPLFLMLVTAYRGILSKLPRKLTALVFGMAALFFFIENIIIYHDYIYHIYIELGRTR